MSSHVVVVSPDVKRVSVKVSPGTYMFDVLEEACKKLNLQVDKWSLKHKNNVINLSDQFRLTSLTPGAKLELVATSKTTSVVNIALKLPEPEGRGIPNGRLTEKFRSDTTLWKMLRQFESKGSPSGHRFNFTDRGIPQTSNGTQAGSGQLFYEMPSLRIMNREISTLADFQKPLSQLGLTSGSHMIQLFFKPTDTTLSAAMQDISQFFKDEEKADAKEKSVVPGASSAKTESLLDTPNPESFDSTDLQAPLVAETEAVVATDFSQGADPKLSDTPPVNAVGLPSDGQTVQGIPQQAEAMEVDDGDVQPNSTGGEGCDSGPSTSSLEPVGIFSAPTNTTPAAVSINVPDSVYTPTIAHAQAHQQNLQANAVNKRLKSDAELAAEAQAAEAKTAAVKKVEVKVRFPDETSAQWIFGPQDTGSTIYKAVRGVMENNSASFKLVLPGPPPPTVIKDEDGIKHNLVRAYKMSGRVLLNLVWEENVSQDIKKAQFLKESFASRAKKVELPQTPQVEDEGESSTPAPAPAPTQSTNNESGAPRKMPKWLKGLSKK